MKEYNKFEGIKHFDENGEEFWLARELTPVLDYVRWESFERVIDVLCLPVKIAALKFLTNFVTSRNWSNMAAEQREKLKIISFPAMLVI